MINLKNPFKEKKLNLFSSNKVEIGYLIDKTNASLIWESPRIFTRKEKRINSAKAVQRCPAVLDYESRFVEVLCPVDLHLRVENRDGKLLINNVADPMSPVSVNKLRELIHPLPFDRWRNANKPIFQIKTPYRFLSDKFCYMEQMPPIFDYKSNKWPGTLIGGRMPIHIWPRILTWAFEWHDINQELILKRGDPWFYARFETGDPTAKIKLVEGKWHQELEDYVQKIDGVTSYINNTFTLFKKAENKRPKKLLKFD